MATGKYRVNPQTLLYEPEEESGASRLVRTLVFFLISVAVSVLYFFLFVGVFHFELPKTTLLRKTNESYRARVDNLDREIDQYEAVLSGLSLRDEGVYRNIFGMTSIGPEARNAGFGGVNRYSYMDELEDGAQLKTAMVKLDRITKKAYVQSKSFDDISTLSARAGDMASCIPAIPPMLMDSEKVRLTSPFGYRSDPLMGIGKFHSGCDLACQPGNPVYATGDGIVESVKFELFGYGNSVLIDHGFGYKSRYAHMKTIYVVEGMKLRRGECIGESGNTGRTTGPHLHYEVFYRNNAVNPANYMDAGMDINEYKDLIETAKRQSSNVLRPHQRMKF